MKHRNGFTEILVRRFLRANRIPVVHPPQAPRLSATKRRWSGSTLKFFAPERGCVQSASRSTLDNLQPLRLGFQPQSRSKLARPLSPSGQVAVFLLFVLTLSVNAAVREVGAIGLTVNDLGRELNFYTNTLAFELVSISEASGKEQGALLGLKSVKLRIATMKLGEERITLTEHFGKKGRPIPQDSRSFDRWFQHIAIVVSDMDKAYARLLEHKVTHVSTAPQTLPEWNKDAGGIKAFYFRDPEDHVLEIIWFPPGKGDPKWQRVNRAEAGLGVPVFLGIDHTAIVVSDTEKSLEFYRDQLGFKVAGSAHNYGTEQEHLNQVFGARLRITTLKAERGPGIEFLEYIAPPGGRDLPADAKANDLVFWNTQLVVDDLSRRADLLRASGARFVSKPNESCQAQIVRDPDGHALQLNQLGGTRREEVLTSAQNN
jgi:catechol 2,3-dioxygenase-like lactoylglutathione lyase family enzyme